MKAGTIFRTLFMVGVTCFVLWRVMPLIDKLEHMGDGLDLATLLTEGQAGAVSQPDQPSEELVVYSPKGDELTDDERRRLLATAARMRPRVREKQARVSLPGNHVLESTQEASHGAEAESIDVDSLVTPEMMQALIEQLQRER